MSNLSDKLQNWATINEFLPEATEQECAELLKIEKKGLNRYNVLLRVYGRFNKLRSERERLDLVKQAGML